MGVLKWIGYIVAALLVIAILASTGMLAFIVVTVLGILLIGAAVVAFIAFCIKDYCESRKSRP